MQKMFLDKRFLPVYNEHIEFVYKLFKHTGQIDPAVLKSDIRKIKPRDFKKFVN